MPFTIADVDKHIKGLGDKQKETWVRVANGALSSCQEKGGTDCEGSAIRQANTVSQKNASQDFTVQTTHNLKGVEIFSVGIWNGDKYTIKDLDQMVEAFEQVDFEPPLKLGHNSEQEKDLMKDGQPALGWVERIFRVGQKLVADFKEIPKAVFDAIESKSYKRVSSEIWFNYGSNGDKFPRVLKAVALLGADIPAVTNLKPIEFDDDGNEFKVYDIDKDELDEEEVEEEVVAQPKQEEDAMSEGMKEANDKLSEEKKELEAKVAKLSEERDEVEAKFAKQQTEAKTSGIKAFMEKAKGEGKILPAFETKLRALMDSASDEKVCKYSEGDKTVESSQFEIVQSLVDSFPNLVNFEELAADGNLESTDDVDLTDRKAVGEHVAKLTKEYMEKNTDVKEYSDAMDAVLNKNPKLKTAYVEG